MKNTCKLRGRGIFNDEVDASAVVKASATALLPAMVSTYNS